MPEDTAIVKAEVVELGTLRADTPSQLIVSATHIATPLAELIDKQKLAVKISGRRYVKAEGWTTLAAMLGVFPQEVSNDRLEDGGFVATVELVRAADGKVISRASAECGMDEPKWAKGPAYARRSMAATRATGKACRLAFSWIMTLGGYEATPFEEMDHFANGDKPTATATVEPQPPPPSAPADPADPEIPFGKNRGKKLSELGDRQLQWYAEQWEPRETDNATFAARDAELKDAIVDAWHKRSGGVKDDEIPF